MEYMYGSSPLCNLRDSLYTHMYSEILMDRGEYFNNVEYETMSTLSSREIQFKIVYFDKLIKSTLYPNPIFDLFSSNQIKIPSVTWLTNQKRGREVIKNHHSRI